LGLVDLQAEETGTLVKYIAEHEIKRQNKTDYSLVAFPIVTGAWYNPTSHVPSPVLYVKEDGTQVTNFPQSLAKWAGVSNHKEECSAPSTGDIESFDFLAPGEPTETFMKSIRKAIRHAESNPKSLEQAIADGPPFDCEKKARFGVTSDMARINYPFSPTEFQGILKNGGYDIDYKASSVQKV
jgi:hypothetical protein